MYGRANEAQYEQRSMNSLKDEGEKRHALYDSSEPSLHLYILVYDHLVHTVSH